MSEKGGSRQRDSLLRIFSRVYALLVRKERRMALLMLGTVVLNSVIEVLGLAAVIPVIGLAVDPELIYNYGFLEQLFEASRAVGLSSEKDFLILLSIALFFVFGVKALLGLLVTLFQTRFSFSVAHRLSGIMWTYHFSQNLEQLRGSNSGQILSEINGWPQAFANVFMAGSLRLVTEFFVVGVICIGLLLYEPVVFVAVSAMVGVGTVLVRRFADGRLRDYGEIQKVRGPKSNAMITNAVRGFLEVITFRAVASVRDEYLRTTKLLFRVSSNSAVINSLPAKMYEVLAVMGVSGAIVFSLWNGPGEEQFFELLTLMAVSAYRVMPSMSRITGAMMAIRRSSYVMDAMERGASSVGSDGRQSMLADIELSGPPTIGLRQVTVGYAAREEPVLSALSHRFAPGMVHAIVGDSGSGKSTLVNAILGLHPLDEGEISIEDGKVEWLLERTCSRESWLGELGYLSQQPFFFSGTVRDNLTFRAPGRELPESLINELIEKLGLRSCLGDRALEFELNEGGTNLSGGQQQRLALIRSLQLTTKVLLLDEATSALDQGSRDKVFTVLKERANRGTLIIIITHDRELAAMCDQVLDLEQ